MNKKKTQIASVTLFNWLIVGVIAIELVSIVFSVLAGQAQADTCPKSSIPRLAAMFLNGVALIVVVTLPFISKNKLSTTIGSIVGVIMIIGISVVTWFLAGGGLDWCAFLGR